MLHLYAVIYNGKIGLPLLAWKDVHDILFKENVVATLQEGLQRAPCLAFNPPGKLHPC